MFRLARQICTEYRHIGLLLEVELYTIEAIQANYSNVIDRAFEVVKAWAYSCEKPDSVTAYKKLCGALSELGREDLVDFVRLGE